MKSRRCKSVDEDVSIAGQKQEPLCWVSGPGLSTWYELPEMHWPPMPKCTGLKCQNALVSNAKMHWPQMPKCTGLKCPSVTNGDSS